MDRLDCDRMFLAVIETGSFTAAAEKLGTRSGQASKLISRLETELGAQCVRSDPADVIHRLGALQRLGGAADDLELGLHALGAGISVAPAVIGCAELDGPDGIQAQEAAEVLVGHGVHGGEQALRGRRRRPLPGL